MPCSGVHCPKKHVKHIYSTLHIVFIMCSYSSCPLRVLLHYQCSSPPLLPTLSRRCATFLTFVIATLGIPLLYDEYNDCCSLNMQHIVLNQLQCTTKVPPRSPPCATITTPPPSNSLLLSVMNVFCIKMGAYECSTTVQVVLDR